MYITIWLSLASEKGLQPNNILRLLVRAEGFNNKSFPNQTMTTPSTL